MSKYIDADLLRKEIEVQRDLFIGHAAILKKTVATDGFDIVIKVIDSLQQEQPEVDIEKEYTEFVVSDPVYSKLVNDIVGKSIAHHFYELGLNARKEK